MNGKGNVNSIVIIVLREGSSNTQKNFGRKKASEASELLSWLPMPRTWRLCFWVTEEFGAVVLWVQSLKFTFNFELKWFTDGELESEIAKIDVGAPR